MSARAEHVLGAAVLEVVAILHGHDRDDLPRCGELPHVDIGEADVADLPLGAQLRQRADRFFERHLRVGTMQLVDVDAIEPQPTQAPLEASRRCSGRPSAASVRAAAHEPGLGREHQTRRVRINASAINSSLTFGPYASAVSIRSTPDATARRNTAFATSGPAVVPKFPGR